ncbi:winged helix-turn-helix transcriptional regulator [Pelagibius marinus]|uniref:winged helix-turn-helix transcriptional regulator n=1 Tax=Pelagibius marinus TaxID=2762760 RepID=UPI0018728F73|nr:helix-turn-helix domain-containing protein [Pelagibius marinus]
MALKIRKNRSPEPPNECPLSKCMEVLKGAWTPNVIWYLSGGPRRFNELRLDIPRVSAKVLTTRLRDLEAKGVVLREVKPTSPPSVEYSLTDLGQQLVPAINAIADVGHKLKERKKARTMPQGKAKQRAAAE